MKRAVAVALLLVLGACSHVVWDKPGATEEEFRRDAYQCERDARMSAGSFGGGLAGAINAQNFMERCMTYEKGYTKRKVRRGG
jgi:hypothetical protein